MFPLGGTVLDTTKDDTVEIVAILEDSFPTVYVVYDTVRRRSDFCTYQI